MARHQSHKGGQLGQQALLRGTQRGMVNETLRGLASNVLRGGGWKIWGWQLDENLGGAPLLSKSHSNCPAKVGGRQQSLSDLQGGGWVRWGSVELPSPRGGAGGRTLRERATTPGPHPGGKVGGHQEESLRCWLVCVKGRNRQAPGGPQRAGKGAGSRRDVRGGAGKLSPRRRGKGALGRGWAPPTAQGKCSRAQQRPLGFSFRVRAG